MNRKFNTAVFNAPPGAPPPPSVDYPGKFLVDLLGSTFASDLVAVAGDRLPQAMGQDGSYAAVFPNDLEQPDPFLEERYFTVQLFHRYDPLIDPRQKVDPETIEGWAERFRQACKLTEVNSLWFFQVQEINYTPDPTGNITRFEARIKTWENG